MATTYMDFLCDSIHGPWKGSQLHGLLVGHRIRMSQPYSVNWDFNKRPNDVEKKNVQGTGLHKGLVIEDVRDNTIVGNEAVAS
ncbi:hypothetical protein ACOSQ4_027262 [Xanthoceras sorbifolium]